jgi:hypothetical protein
MNPMLSFIMYRDKCRLLQYEADGLGRRVAAASGGTG